MATKFEKQLNYKDLSQNEIESVSGGDWFSSGFTGASIGGAVGFGVGVAYYYFAN